MVATKGKKDEREASTHAYNTHTYKSVENVWTKMENKRNEKYIIFL